MKDPGCGPEAWTVLDGKLWHATSLDGLREIRQDRSIGPGNRYKGSFVSARGWVSLFDFGPSARDDWNLWEQWAQWFGGTHDEDLSAWLEVDRKAGKNKIVEAEELRVLWRAEVDQRMREGLGEPWAGTIIAGVEGCCPSSKQMGLLSVFHKGGSGSSLFDVKPLGFDGSSGGFGWSVF